MNRVFSDHNVEKESNEKVAEGAVYKYVDRPTKSKELGRF